MWWIARTVVNKIGNRLILMTCSMNNYPRCHSNLSRSRNIPWWYLLDLASLPWADLSNLWNFSPQLQVNNFICCRLPCFLRDSDETVNRMITESLKFPYHWRRVMWKSTVRAKSAISDGHKAFTGNFTVFFL